MTSSNSSYDPLGQACLDFIAGNKNVQITVRSNISEDDVIPVSYLFRELSEMPILEQKALSLCRGKILDIGAGAGTHSLVLQQQSKDVEAVEISSLACEAMKKRGITNITNADFYKMPGGNQYNTLLLLMNGIGLAGNIHNLPVFFKKCKELLAPEGQIIVDSSDLRYLFEEDDGSLLLNLNDNYYGEIKYQMEYKGVKNTPFDWLFLDSELFKFHARNNGFTFEKIADGPHYDFLVRLTVAN